MATLKLEGRFGVGMNMTGCTFCLCNRLFETHPECKDVFFLFRDVEDLERLRTSRELRAHGLRSVTNSAFHRIMNIPANQSMTAQRTTQYRFLPPSSLTYTKRSKHNSRSLASVTVVTVPAAMQVLKDKAGIMRYFLTLDKTS